MLLLIFSEPSASSAVFFNQDDFPLWPRGQGKVRAARHVTPRCRLSIRSGEQQDKRKTRSFLVISICVPPNKRRTSMLPEIREFMALCIRFDEQQVLQASIRLEYHSLVSLAFVSGSHSPQAQKQDEQRLC